MNSHHMPEPFLSRGAPGSVVVLCSQDAFGSDHNVRRP